ncbi:MAG: carbonic anhydrase [Planctomycetia bacterium]|nr:carbonic anhydrase [Planctomycetia bacterium]
MIGTDRLHLLGLALALASSTLAFAQDKPPTPDEALKKLKAGNARFAAEKSTVKDLGDKRRIELAQGQRPFAVVLTCSDSRVVPEFMFDAGLGELFPLRVAGNVSGQSIFASIEYATAELKAPLVVVIGHSKCGAVDTALKGKDLPSENLKKLIGLVHLGEKLPAEKDEALNAAIRNNVRYHAKQLTEQSTIIKDFVGAGRIRIATGVYSIKTGLVDWLD